MDVTNARWRTSSFSGNGNNGNGCVEVAFLPGDAVAMRDTKDRALAPHLYPAADWHAFLSAIRAGEFNHS